MRVKELQMISVVSTSNVYIKKKKKKKKKKTLSELQSFTVHLTFKLFHVTIIVANIGSLKYYL